MAEEEGKEEGRWRENVKRNAAGKRRKNEEKRKTNWSSFWKGEEKKQHLTFFLLSSVVLCFVVAAFLVDCRQKKLFLTPSTGCVPRRSSPKKE